MLPGSSEKITNKQKTHLTFVSLPIEAKSTVLSFGRTTNPRQSAKVQSHQTPNRLLIGQSEVNILTHLQSGHGVLAQVQRSSSISMRISASASLFGLWLGPQGCMRNKWVRFRNHFSAKGKKEAPYGKWSQIPLVWLFGGRWVIHQTQDNLCSWLVQ